MTFFIQIFFLIFLVSCSGTVPSGLGVKEGKLAPCPDKPNCVSSTGSTPGQKVDPLKFQGSLQESKDRLKKVLISLGRNKIITETDHYMHVEFTSLILRFVDDVEFYFDKQAQLIQIRGASRLGHWDMGVNLERVHKIHFEYIQM